MYDSTKQADSSYKQGQNSGRTSNGSPSPTANGDNQTTMSQVADQAKQTFNETVDDVKQQATSKLAEQKQQTADRLNSVATALRSTSEGLHNQDETIAQYVDGFADQVEKVSSYIQNKDIGELLKDAQQLARRQPELFVAGALAAGFLVGRFLKGTSPTPSNTYNNRTYGQSQYGQGQSNQGQYPMNYGNDQRYVEGRQYGTGQQYGSQGQYGTQFDPTTAGTQYPYGDPAINRLDRPSDTGAVAPDDPRAESEENYAR